jgi:hypothetical protein
MGSNPSQSMDVCLRLFCVCVALCSKLPCVGLIPRPRSPTYCLRLINWSEMKRFTDRCMDGWIGRQAGRDYYSLYITSHHVKTSWNKLICKLCRNTGKITYRFLDYLSKWTIVTWSSSLNFVFEMIKEKYISRWKASGWTLKQATS